MGETCEVAGTADSEIGETNILLLKIRKSITLLRLEQGTTGLSTSVIFQGDAQGARKRGLYVATIGQVQNHESRLFGNQLDADAVKHPARMIVFRPWTTVNLFISLNEDRASSIGPDVPHAALQTSQARHKFLIS
jgi:hypothetical protein